MKTRIWLMFSVTAILTALFASLLLHPSSMALAGPKADSYWNVDEILPGMRGYGRTVMKGTKIESFDAEVLGVSVDSAWSHKAYADKMGIKYSLLADFQPRGAMAEKYGVFLADKGITGRSIIIVNRDGKIAWTKNYDIPVVPDVAEVASALQQVKTASA